MKKKMLSLLLTGAMLACILTGCGKGEEQAVQSQTEEETTQGTQETPSVDLSTEEQGEESVTITYANFNASGGNEETLAKMYEAFHEE